MLRLFCLFLALALSSPAQAKKNPSPVPTAEATPEATPQPTAEASPVTSPAPTPTWTPEISRYGWVGTWNYSLSVMGASDGLAQKQDFSALDYISSNDYDSFYNSSRAEMQSSFAYRLRAEKVLSSAYASGFELDYGSSQLSQLSRHGDDYYYFGTHYLSDELYQTKGLAQRTVLSWVQHAQSSGAWVPAGGWTWRQGPQGRAWHPSLETKLSVISDSLAGMSYELFSVQSSIPVFNGFSVVLGYSSPIRRSYYADSSYYSYYIYNYYEPDGGPGILSLRTSVDSASCFETFISGFSFNWPQFGHPDPLKDSNPDGRLFRPSLSWLFRDFAVGGYSVAQSVEWSLKVPVTTGSTLCLSSEQLQTTAALPPLQRYSFSWQIYAGPPAAPQAL